MKGRKLAQISLASACLLVISTIGSLLVSCSSSSPIARTSPNAQPGAAQPSPAPTPFYDGTPQIDLQSLLQQSQQGSGGGGRSPFREASGDKRGLQRRVAPFDYNGDGDTDDPGEGRVAGVVDRRAFADASCLPPLNEEVWVIERPHTKAAQINEDIPGCGSLMTCLPEQPTQQVPVPLKHTEVNASIAGAIASVEVTQQFFNPFAGKIEAVYVFPLPENAAVNEFIMTVGDRRIRGIIREREEAQRIYQEARAQGYVASLLTEERPNIFTQKVANIEPGKGIDITIRYFNTLAYSDGEFEFVFPMVVGPRFNPPHRTDGVYARPEGAPPQNTGDARAVETQHLRPERRSGHDIGVQVAIDTGSTPLANVECRSHVVQVERPSSGEPGKALVRLSPSDSIPNKDFVLRYKLAGDSIRTSVVAYQGERGGYFSMMLVPPADIQSAARRPLEMVFVLDCSGSMSGEPLAQAKRAIERALKQLDQNDTFQVIRFSNNASSLGPAPIGATQPNIRRALDYLASLNSEGGTMMIEGIHAALDFPHDPSRLRFVCFLTDGYIGNEDEILAAIQQKLGPTRIFSFGIGSSVNRYLMDSMARLGRGAVSYLAAGDNAGDIMDAFVTRISRAPMTDIRVEFDGLAVNAGDVFPSRIPDLFAGRPVIISGRFSQGGPALRAGSEPQARVTGNVAGERRTYTVPVRVNASDNPGTPAALAAVWARHKIAALADAGASGGPAEVAGNIRQVALEFGLMSPYTAFLAVDSSTRTEGSYGTTVPVPVPVPEGVRYDTTVPERSPYR